MLHIFLFNSNIEFVKLLLTKINIFWNINLA